MTPEIVQRTINALEAYLDGEQPNAQIAELLNFWRLYYQFLPK
jgi:hypothetical protein